MGSEYYESTYEYNQERLLTRDGPGYELMSRVRSVEAEWKVYCSMAALCSILLALRWLFKSRNGRVTTVLSFVFQAQKKKVMSTEISSPDRQDEFIEDYLTERDIYKRVPVRSEKKLKSDRSLTPSHSVIRKWNESQLIWTSGYSCSCVYPPSSYSVHSSTWCLVRVFCNLRSSCQNYYRLVWIYSIRVAIYALAATDTKYRVLQWSTTEWSTWRNKFELVDLAQVHEIRSSWKT